MYWDLVLRCVCLEVQGKDSLRFSVKEQFHIPNVGMQYTKYNVNMYFVEVANFKLKFIKKSCGIFL